MLLWVLQSALRSLSTQLSGAQVGITVTTLAIGFLAEPAIAELLRGPLEAWAWPRPRGPTVPLRQPGPQHDPHHGLR